MSTMSGVPDLGEEERDSWNLADMVAAGVSLADFQRALDKCPPGAIDAFGGYFG